MNDNINNETELRDLTDFHNYINSIAERFSGDSSDAWWEIHNIADDFYDKFISPRVDNT
jgi:sulfur relay (sulfurtransferase) DsrC/TusE family protein